MAKKDKPEGGSLKKEPATKDDLKNLETRLEARLDKMDGAMRFQASTILSLQKKDEEILAAIKQTEFRILSAVDAFAKDTKDVERDVALQSGHLQDHDADLKDHGRRLVKLELGLLPPA